MYAAKLSAAYGNIPVGMTADGGAKIKGKPALITQPLVHIGGLFWVVHSLLDARPVSLLDKFNVEQWAHAVEQYQIRVCSLVPAMINMVLESDLPSGKLASLICVRSGTAPLSVEAQQAFEQRFGVPILPTYGATEFSGAVCGWTLESKKAFGDSKAGSVGMAYEGVDLQIVDPESGELLAVGDTGILQVRSDQMAEENDWVSTTDLARIDADGFVWLSGRADAAINRGGFKIIPTEVAAILETNAQVKEASVVGIDDARLGQVPVAAVELSAMPAGFPRSPEILGKRKHDQLFCAGAIRNCRRFTANTVDESESGRREAPVRKLMQAEFPLRIWMRSTMFETITYETHDDHVATVTINRPMP